MVIEKFKFENRTSDGEIFLPIGRDDSPVYFVLYDFSQSLVLRKPSAANSSIFRCKGSVCAKTSSPAVGNDLLRHPISLKPYDLELLCLLITGFLSCFLVFLFLRKRKEFFYLLVFG